MAAHRYVGEEPRYYPELGLEVEPGQVVELDTAPDDGRFEPAKGKQPAPDTNDKEVSE